MLVIYDIILTYREMEAETETGREIGETIRE